MNLYQFRNCNCDRGSSFDESVIFSWCSISIDNTTKRWIWTKPIEFILLLWLGRVK